MEENLSIPIENRSQKVEPFLKQMLEIIVNLRNSELKDKINYSINLCSLIYPWLVETADSERQIFSNFGFDGDRIKNELTEILKEDKHLHECCINEFILARWFDKFIESVLHDSENKTPSDPEFNEQFLNFSNFTYLQPFIASSYSHLFNFTSELRTLNFGELNIVRLNQFEVSTLLGEYTPHSFLHPIGTGEYFIVSRITGVIPNDVSWLFDEQEKAENLARIFQYYKDGIVHVNYTTHYFLPEWVNAVRKNGIFFIGGQRKLSYEMGNKMYLVNETEHQELADWWNIFQLPEVVTKFGESRNKLGQTIEAAATYYESSHEQLENVRRLIDLSITLEALFSPYNQNEISFQLSQLAAQFIGESVVEKQQIFKDIKKMYDKRSKLFHGSYDAHNDNFISTDEIENFASILRRGLLKFVTLYIRGEESHKNIIERIRESLFDPRVRRNLKKEANLSLLLKEIKAKINI